MKKNINAIVFSVAIVLAAVFLGNAYKAKIDSKGNIVVTGLGEESFTSDLIVWEGSFSKSSPDLKQAYAELETDKKMVEEYLVSKGVNMKEVVFKAVETEKNTRPLYNKDGRYAGDEFVGYTLRVPIQISSKEVEKIEEVSRKITELLNKGISFYSETPRYYYTKLADLKIQLISKATEDAKNRAETISKMSGAGIGKLVDAQTGIFQITGQYSNEEYSWGGTFNTSSKEKVASITIKLTYRIR